MKKKSIIILVSFVAVVGLVIGFKTFKKSSKKEIVYAEIQIERGTFETSVLSTGTVKPENRLELKPPVAGRVEQVLTKEGATVRKGQILAWMSTTERAAVIDAARARGPEEVQKWEGIFKQTPIIAPITGTIILKSVEAGQTFTTADAVFVMSDHLTVKAQVDETDIATIKIGQKAMITLDAYPSQPVKAKVEKLAYDAEVVNNVTTYVVDVIPNKTPEFMRSGMTANVTFNVNHQDDVMLIPVEAIMREEGKTSVLIQTPEGKISQEIILGDENGKVAVVKSGLKGDEKILVSTSGILNDSGDQKSNIFSPFGGARKSGSGGKRH